MQREVIESDGRSDKTGKNKASYHNRCGTTKTLQCSMTLSRQHDTVVRAEVPLLLIKVTLITAIFILYLGLCLMIIVFLSLFIAT